MKFKIKELLTASLLGLLALPALAETDWGINLGFGYHKNTDADSTLNEVFGQVKYSYDRFGVQLDLGSNKYSFESSRRGNLGLHTYYGLTDGFKLGAYYGRQDWFGLDYDYYGLEAAYETDQLKIDGHVGKFEPSGGSGNTLFGFDMSYLLYEGGFGNGPFSSGPSSGPSSSFGGRYYLIGGWHGVRDGLSENLIYLGASSELRPGMFLDLRASRSAGDNQLGLMLRTEFDGGVPFHPRGWTAGFKSW